MQDVHRLRYSSAEVTRFTDLIPPRVCWESLGGSNG